MSVSMAGSSSYIAVVGSVNADLTVRVDRRPAPGETVEGSTFTVSPGGKGANQALAAARQGAAVAMVAAVGDDPYRDVALTHLRASRVDLNAVATVETTTGLAHITVDGDGDNSIIVIAGANGQMNADLVSRSRPAIAGAAVVVVQMEIPVDGIEQAVAMASGRVIVNLAPVVPAAPEVLRKADPLVVNEHEAAAARAILTGAWPTVQPLASGAEARCVQDLIDLGVPSVVCTLGGRGSLVGPGGGSSIESIPALKVTVADTTGAGDAFVGTMAARLLAGDKLIEACRQATRVAAFSVQKPGAQDSYPDLTSDLPTFPAID
jgi:ribokinase